jgi:alpha-tubulin suppressor-like RCC1 family protein
MNMSSCSTFALMAAAAALFSCGSGSPGSSASGPPAGSESAGQVSLAITIVPPGVQCIQITATGSYTVTQNFAATPDAGTANSLMLGELPLGSVAITGQAFNVACASIASQQPSWVASKQVVTLQAGVITPLTITFRPDNAVPATPTFVGNVVQVALGYGEIVALLSDGTVEGAGDVGNLYDAPAMVVLPGVSNVAQIATSANGIWDCALLKNGTVECWGDGGSGQLGNGSNSSSSTPVPVTGLTNVLQICTGAAHACALESSGNAVCWGLNANGQLGNNSTTNANTPVPVQSFPSNVTSIACGGFHTCANASGTVYCWGANTYGELGIGSSTDAHIPAVTSGLTAIGQLALGLFHSCGVRMDGLVYCWGYNGNGQLGLGNLSSSLTPALVSIGPTQQLAAGLSNTCARRNDGVVLCWGSDGSGEGGDGSGKSGNLSPTPVINLPSSSSIAAGAYTLCSVGTDLSFECWGYNPYGAFGSLLPLNEFTPVPVAL